MLCLVMLFFSLGPGPLTFVVVNEIVPLHLRAKLVTLSVFCNRLGSGTIALTFLSLKHAIGTFAAFSLYAVLGLAVTLLYAVAVPDMKGRSLEGGDPAEGPADPPSAGADVDSVDVAGRALLSLQGSGLPAERSDESPDGGTGGAKPGLLDSGCGVV